MNIFIFHKKTPVPKNHESLILFSHFFSSSLTPLSKGATKKAMMTERRTVINGATKIIKSFTKSPPMHDNLFGFQ